MTTAPVLSTTALTRPSAPSTHSAFNGSRSMYSSGSVSLTRPSAGIGFLVVNAMVTGPIAPATSEASETTASGRSWIVNMVGMTATSASMPAPVWSRVRISYGCPKPGTCWFLTPKNFSATGVPASNTTPALSRVMRTAWPTTWSVKPPVMPKRGETSGETASRFISAGNSTSISPSAGSGFVGVKRTVTEVTLPASVVACCTDVLCSSLTVSIEPGTAMSASMMWSL
mmetsp:Transcript_64915/g.135353  ORF Transcript_64915/g.135353 Transcript_64915/m.135353 type:complete len:228 (+) Transcript_64915:4213-4896(+)